MELRQLLYLVTVAEEASFTRAAKRLRVAQPGISAQVRLLEQELGQALFDRSGRTVRLTAVGEAVLPSARAALAAVAGARDTVAELAGLTRGRIAVGTLVACNLPGLTGLLGEFHRAHPGVEITLVEANSDELVARLHDGGLDLALVGLAGPRLANLETAPLLEEPLVAAVGTADAWARRAGMTLAELCERPLICLPPGTGVRSALDGGAARAGVRPRVAFEAASPVVIADLAAHGLGVAVLPASVAASRRDLHTIPLTRPKLRSRIELAWRAGGPTTPAARAFLARARRVLAPAGAASMRGGTREPDARAVAVGRTKRVAGGERRRDR